MTGIDWSLATKGQNAFERSMKQGVAIGDAASKAAKARDMREALDTLSRNPQDAAARAVVFQQNPQLAMKMDDSAREQEFRSAVGQYIGDATQPNALLAFGNRAVSANNPRNALAERVTNAPTAFEGAFQALSRQDAQPPEQVAAAPGAYAFLGSPRRREDASFLRMVRSDPVQAMKIQSAMRDNFMDRLQAESDFYSHAVDALSRATDDGGWQAGLQRLAPMAEALGGDLSSVPTTYPGAEAVQQLLQQALPVKDRLDYLLRETNMQADNSRQDRNADSLIEDRTARREEQARYNNARIATAQRGQDISASRGTGTGGRRSSRRSEVRPTATDAQGNKVEWNGAAWVPVK